MADLKLNHVYKVYDGGVKAVNDFNIDIKDKEFIVFVGPSGCGKSTTLRMIAGLEDITAGDLFIQDQLVNDVQPKDRDIAMVFQNYALYPHMTVYENMAFSLKNRHMPKDEINRRVLEAARILDIEDYLQRKPKAMSGGQRQRVSLGRAIVRQPKVFLLDEPLSNLDAKLRAQMRTEIAKLHKKLQTTFIYVTHDQVEAMTMGTRIVVMKLGFVQQIDTPTNLYNHPANKFVAGFIGTPQMNFFDATVLREKDSVKITFADKQFCTMDMSNFYKCNPSYLNGETHVTFGVRPNHLQVVDGNATNGINLIVTEIEALGNETLLYCNLANEVILDNEKVNKSSVIVSVSAHDTYKVGDRVKVLPKDDYIHLFDNETEQTLMPLVPEFTYQTIDFEQNTYTLFGKTYNRFQAWEKIPVVKNVKVKIPHSAIVPGQAFSLKVVKVEEITDNGYIVILHNHYNDSYLSVKSEVAPKVGDMYSFGLKYGDLILDEEMNVAPVTENVSIIGKFHKVKEMDTKDDLLKQAEVKYEKERLAVKKLVSKTYLTLEENGANSTNHQKAVDLFNNLLKANYQGNYEADLKKIEELQEQIKKQQKSGEIQEASYLALKKELLELANNVSSNAQLVATTSLKEIKGIFEENSKLSDGDLIVVKSQYTKLINQFEKEVQDIIKPLSNGVELVNKEKANLEVDFNETFSSHRLYMEDFVLDYFNERLESFKKTESYTKVAKTVQSEIFDNGNDSKDNDPKNAKLLFSETVKAYKYAISATESYVRGLYLGNSTRWHKQASENADVYFDNYNKIHDLYIESFRLANKTKTSDFKLKKITNYYMELGGAKFRLKDSLIARLVSIEGAKLLKNNYKFVFKPLIENIGDNRVSAVQEKVVEDAKKIIDQTTQIKAVSKYPDPSVVSENLDTTEIRSISNADLAKFNTKERANNIQHEIVGIRNFNAHTFVGVKFGDIYNDIEITGLRNDKDYYISCDIDAGVAIYTTDTQIRIA